MIRRALFATAANLALLTAAPAFAQEEGVDEDVSWTEEAPPPGGIPGLEMLANLFGTAEPLTAEEEARLPAAEQVAASLLPDGTYVKIINATATPMIETMLGTLSSPGIGEIARKTGVDSARLASVDPEALEAAAALLDPYADDRQQMMGQLITSTMTKTVAQIEPALRAGMARAYAVRFTSSELADLSAYFRTPVGAKFAAESVPVMVDPQVMSAMNDLLPAMFEAMPAMFEAISLVEREFPAPRDLTQLGPDERAQLAEILGLTMQELDEAEANLSQWKDVPAPPATEEYSEEDAS